MGNAFLFWGIIIFVFFLLCKIFAKKKPSVDPRVIAKEVELVMNKAQASSLESIKIIPKKINPKRIFSSKFGGYPYWPSNKDYLFSKKKKPLRLLAQINLGELPENNLLPSSGLLQFFISDYGSLGLEWESRKRTIDDIISTPSEYRVIYHKEISNDDALAGISGKYPIRAKSNFPFDGEYSLTFKPEMHSASPVDYRFDRIVENFDDLHEESIDKVFEKLVSGGCRLGGYAYFTQDDLRYLKPDEDWLLLFQMDTVIENEVNIMWGDAGVANFFIRPSDLHNLDFSKVWFSWDCS